MKIPREICVAASQAIAPARDAITQVRIDIDVCAAERGMGCESFPINKVALSQKLLRGMPELRI